MTTFSIAAETSAGDSLRRAGKRLHLGFAPRSRCRRQGGSIIQSARRFFWRALSFPATRSDPERGLQEESQDRCLGHYRGIADAIRIGRNAVLPNLFGVSMTKGIEKSFSPDFMQFLPDDRVDVTPAAAHSQLELRRAQREKLVRDGSESVGQRFRV